MAEMYFYATPEWFRWVTLGIMVLGGVIAFCVWWRTGDRDPPPKTQDKLPPCGREEPETHEAKGPVPHG